MGIRRGGKGHLMNASVAHVLLPKNTVCVLTNFHILQTSYWLSMYDRLEETNRTLSATTENVLQITAFLISQMDLRVWTYQSQCGGHPERDPGTWIWCRWIRSHTFSWGYTRHRILILRHVRRRERERNSIGRMEEGKGAKGDNGSFYCA